MRQIFLTRKLSVVDLTPIYAPREGIEFMWRGADWPLGRMDSRDEDRALDIAERIHREAENEDQALAIFEEEMS